ncbi:hypothetical protein [Dubosiella muris]|nr:hypothetical protein [Dubosiella muris]
MKPYAEVYLDDVVETQGKLFEYVAETFPEADFQKFCGNVYEKQDPSIY